MRFLFHAVADQFNPLGWSFYHFIWQGMLVAALYSAGCLVCGADARRRHALACFFLGVSLVLPIWQIWMILVRHHGLALGNGPPERLLDWMTWAALLWIGVAGAISLRTLAGAVILRRQWLADATEDAVLSETARSVALQISLKRPPRVLRSRIVDVPAVLGWWRPVVMMPSEMPGCLTDARLRAILAHELAHVERRDPLINLVQSVLEPFVLFHPAAAWLAGEVRKAREHCCDDIAVDVSGDAIGYARGLTSLAKLRGLENRAALSASGGDLKARVVRLVAKRRFAWWIWSDAGRFLCWLGCAAVLRCASEIVCRMM